MRTTSDGVLLTFHDEVLDRVTDRTGTLCELPWSEVSQARIDGQPIPRLEEVLAAWPDVRVNIDAKDDSAVAPLADVIERAKAHDRVCVAAFSDARLRRFRRLVGEPGVHGHGSEDDRPPPRRRLPGPDLALCRRLRPGPVAPRPHPHHRAPVPGRAPTAGGLHVHVWTIDDPAEMDRLLDLGVDGIMTDRPAVLREVLERRGQWVGPPS